MIKQSTITVDAKNKLPHGTVRRAPQGFAHAILLDQMGNEEKWHIIDLYGPMETETDRDVADWPIVYVPAPDEVWETMNSQPSYRDQAAEEFGQHEGPLLPPVLVLCKHCQHAEQIHMPIHIPHARRRCAEGGCDCPGFEQWQPVERVYPVPAFVIPCKDCDHKKWIHDNETGECHGRVDVPGAVCDCTGFSNSVSRPEKWVGETEPPVPLFACLCGHRLHEHFETDPPFCTIRGCPCVGFKEDS